MLLTRRPEETFAAEDETDWMDGLRFSVRRVNPTVVERISGDTIMIINVEQYQKAQEELRQLEDRLHRLQQDCYLTPKKRTGYEARFNNSN
jgi:hypothetical protein